MAKILVVDDDGSTRLVFKMYLSKDGHTVETAVDGMDALEKVPVFKPELILLDINMPKMSGFEVLKRLKDSPETRAIPVFIMTSLHQEANIRKGYQLGAEEYITKPSNIEHLKLRIKKHFAKTPEIPGASAAASIPKTPNIERMQTKVNVFLKQNEEPPDLDDRIAKIVDLDLLKKKLKDVLDKQ
jgi:CheY-like chemotaxis protein